MEILNFELEKILPSWVVPMIIINNFVEVSYLGKMRYIIQTVRVEIEATVIIYERLF